MKCFYLSAFVFVGICCVDQSLAAEIKIDFLMDTDPELPVPGRINDFNPNLKKLWLAALERPDSDMQRMAAETIARGHKYGIPGLDAAIPRLENLLTAKSGHPAVRFSAARALIALESKESGEKLFEASQAFGMDLRQLVEPVLADWDNSSAKTVWSERLRSSETRPQELILSIRGLGRVHEQSSVPELLEIVAELSRGPNVRLEAATAVGQISETGLESDAERLAKGSRGPMFIDQLCAIRLLARHRSDAATAVLLSLANHSEPAVAGASLKRLNEIDSSLVISLAEAALKSSDPLVREEGIVAIAKLPTTGRVAALSQLLSDSNPHVRRKACAVLSQLSAEDDLKTVIVTEAVVVLEADGWEGQEQASLLLGTLEHKDVADRLIELLQSTRMEVGVTAAWALRRIAVPETIPALVQQAIRQTEFRRNNEQQGLDKQVALLFEALGVLQAEEAMPLLLGYLPKKSVDRNRLSRAAAIWAIGRINTGETTSELEEQLSGRIFDFSPRPFEKSLVKQMCAIALGRMKAVGEAESLRQFAASDDLDIPLQLALGWAVKELTGEELPSPKPLAVSQGSWFLEPLAD